MIISKTPVRISFIGGGSDIVRKSMKVPGRVISTTINKFIYVIIKKNLIICLGFTQKMKT